MTDTVFSGARSHGPPLNATAAALLGLLLEGEMTGWDLMQAAQQRIGEFWTLTSSQVYRELGSMADRGLVQAGPRGLRARRPYGVTEAGRAAFAEWLYQAPGEDHVRIPLLLTIAFAAHLPPRRLTAIITAQREIHQQRVDRYHAAREALELAGEIRSARRATLEFGLRHELAVLEWFDALPDHLPDRHP